MNKKIEKKIIELLKDRNHLPIQELRKKVSNTREYSESDVSRIFNLMRDRGEVDYVGGSTDLVRLTNKGLESNKPISKKIFGYLIQNWIAILALIISGVALLK
ncbi:MAG: hypothetical protein KGH93_01555 [Patescibacteria group bacterium]|nr:hypothetical protein [Patescibacteria group bacterium]